MSLVAAPAGAAPNCSNTSTGLIPLTELGSGEYQGSQGGLYPGGSNDVPPDHLELGLRLAEQVVPRAADGTPDADGKVVFISIGVSSTLGQFKGLLSVIEANGGVDDSVLIANTAQVGRALGQWSQPGNDSTWNRADGIIGDLGATPEQVQVAWMMLPPRTRGPRDLTRAREEVGQLVAVAQRAKAEYPNLQLLYVSSRMYGGYINDTDSEPNAYLHGFSTKWLIEDQINGAASLNADPDKGTVLAPWLDWGPYLWADGLTPRADGLTWECDDYAFDGVHPREDTGAVKVGQLLYDDLMADPTASWFRSGEGAALPPASEAPTTSVATTTPPTTANVDGNAADPVRESTPSTDRVRRSDRDQVTAAPAAGSDGWPGSALVGVGLAGVILGGIAGAAASRLWSQRAT